MPENQWHLSTGADTAPSVLSLCNDLKARMPYSDETREITRHADEYGSWTPNIDLPDLPIRSLGPGRLMLDIAVLAIYRMRGIGMAARNSRLRS